MKEIKAYIKAMKRESVTRALHQVEGVTGASFSEVMGFGRGKAESSGYRPDASPSGYVKHVKVEVVCEDAIVAEVVAAIHAAAHTGLRGDGRIFVSDIERSLCIQDALHLRDG
ncbi:MAG: P-II family nitrogen regulator [Kiritimatiellae bacterium]|nr:P-II family nitrogen regulator [Kiritimatiellia bacterium]